MRQGIVLFLVLVVLCAIPQSARAGAISHLRPGQEAQFNQIIVRCESRRAVATFGETGSGGRGLLEASYADCRFANGTSVRIKGGYKTPPLGFGTCGGDPGKILSVWVGARKLVSAETYVPYCSELILKSVTVTADRAVICQLSRSEDPQRDFERVYTVLPEKAVCSTYRLGPASPKDFAEFPPDGRDPNIGSLSAVGSASERAFCLRFIIASDPTMVAVPRGARQPSWTALSPDPNPPDVGNVGFNATTFSFGRDEFPAAGTKAAQFDLENDGRVTNVYQHDEENGWFYGSAFARDRPGILTAPFDAHDWDRSAKDGIYPFVYEQATVFFDQGKTYILLDPANGNDDPRIVTIASGQAQTICTLQRQQENF